MISLLICVLSFAVGWWLGRVLFPPRNRFPRPWSPLADPDAVLLFGDGTRVRTGDIPRLSDGRVDPAWLDDKCKCGRKHT